MLYSFKVKNYRSILDEQEIDFTSCKRYDDSVTYSATTDKYVNNISLIVGGNGSGKTSILNALTFFFIFMQESSGVPLKPNTMIIHKHKLALNEPTTFELCFGDCNKLYKFELEVDGNQEISKEILYVKDTTKFSYIYKILKDKDLDINPKKDIDLDVRKKLKKEFEFIRDKQIRTSFFATLIRYELSKKLLGIEKISNSFVSNMAPLHLIETGKIDKVISCSRELQKDTELLNKVKEYVKKISSDIEDLNYDGDMIYKLDSDSKEERVLNFVHHSQNKKFNLDFLNESEGTCAFIEKLMLFLSILESGGIAVIDEIDNSLHPILLKNLIGLFADKETNKKNAQLIFTTHHPLLMNDRSKNQIYLTEKINLSTEIYRLDEIPGVRNIENFAKKYLNGEYGGIPEIGVF